MHFGPICRRAMCTLCLWLSFRRGHTVTARLLKGQTVWEPLSTHPPALHPATWTTLSETDWRSPLRWHHDLEIAITIFDQRSLGSLVPGMAQVGSATAPRLSPRPYRIDYRIVYSVPAGQHGHDRHPAGARCPRCERPHQSPGTRGVVTCEHGAARGQHTTLDRSLARLRCERKAAPAN